MESPPSLRTSKDFDNVGHLAMARQNIAMVLAEKVRQGAFSRPEASLVARRLMRDNPAEFYGIDVAAKAPKAGRKKKSAS